MYFDVICSVSDVTTFIRSRVSFVITSFVYDNG